jgi:hypothetical protein
MYHGKPLVCILTKNKGIHLLYRLLSFQAFCMFVNMLLITFIDKVSFIVTVKF